MKRMQKRRDEQERNIKLITALVMLISALVELVTKLLDR